MDLSKKKKKKKKRDSNIMAHNNPQLVLVTTFTILSQKSNRYNFLPLRLSSFEKKKSNKQNYCWITISYKITLLNIFLLEMNFDKSTVGLYYFLFISSMIAKFL